MPDALIHVGFEFDWLELGLVELLGHGCEHTEYGRKGFGLLPAQDLQKRLTLLGVRAFVDDREPFTASLVNGARPGKHSRRLQSVQLHIAEMALVDAQADDCAAVAVAGQGVEACARNWCG